MRKLLKIFTILLSSWALAIGIDGFYGGVTAGQVGASISLVGGAIGWLLVIASYFVTSPKEKSKDCDQEKV